MSRRENRLARRTRNRKVVGAVALVGLGLAMPLGLVLVTEQPAAVATHHFSNSSPTSVEPVAVLPPIVEEPTTTSTQPPDTVRPSVQTAKPAAIVEPATTTTTVAAYVEVPTTLPNPDSDCTTHSADPFTCGG